MKKVLLLLSVMLLTLGSCNKDSVDIQEVSASMVEQSFDLSQFGEQFAAGANKRADYKNKDGEEILYPLCTEEATAYVEVTIDGKLYRIEMTSLEGQTEVVQLESTADNIITEFEVFSADGTAIYAMPLAGSKEALAGLTSLPLDLDLGAFTKNKTNVDVICWNDYAYRALAWGWYEIGYYEINTLCFFGDVCTKFFEDFHEEGSPYFGQSYDGYDFPAIFSVNIYNDGVLVGTESNVSWQGTGTPLCIEYVDDPLVDEDFTFEIIFSDPLGDTSVYTGTFQDGQRSEEGVEGSFGGVDGLFTFAIGNCDSQGINDVDLVLPAYIPLPAQAQFMVSGTTYDNGYLSLEVRNLDETDIAVGLYEVASGVEYAGWCAAKTDFITRDVWYAANIYSSLNPSVIPSYYSGLDLGALNWLVNNQDGYSNEEIQAAIWFITDAFGTGNAASAAALSNSTFSPKVGDWAVVFFDAIEDDKESDVQLFMVRVDP